MVTRRSTLRDSAAAPCAPTGEAHASSDDDTNVALVGPSAPKAHRMAAGANGAKLLPMTRSAIALASSAEFGRTSEMTGSALAS